MIKNYLLVVAGFVASMGLAWAQVDVNKADATALDAVKGIGPAKSKRIVDERNKNGDFRDWADLQHRIKGIGAKTATRWSQAGLLVNGKGYGSALPAAGKAKVMTPPAVAK